jgi:hypothetical protein
VTSPVVTGSVAYMHHGIYVKQTDFSVYLFGHRSNEDAIGLQYFIVVLTDPFFGSRELTH